MVPNFGCLITIARSTWVVWCGIITVKSYGKRRHCLLFTSQNHFSASLTKLTPIASLGFLTVCVWLPSSTQKKQHGYLDHYFQVYKFELTQEIPLLSSLNLQWSCPTWVDVFHTKTRWEAQVTLAESTNALSKFSSHRNAQVAQEFYHSIDEVFTIGEIASVFQYRAFCVVCAVYGGFNTVNESILGGRRIETRCRQLDRQFVVNRYVRLRMLDRFRIISWNDKMGKEFHLSPVTPFLHKKTTHCEHDVS